jgi:hypothetical protein
MVDPQLWKSVVWWTQLSRMRASSSRYSACSSVSLGTRQQVCWRQNHWDVYLQAAARQVVPGNGEPIHVERQHIKCSSGCGGVDGGEWSETELGEGVGRSEGLGEEWRLENGSGGGVSDEEPMNAAQCLLMVSMMGAVGGSLGIT